MRGDIRAYPTVEYLQAMLERGVCDACGTTEPGE